MKYQPRHRRARSCPVCSLETARRIQQDRNRRQGGYSPPPRCAAHPLDLSKLRVPAGPAPGAAVSR